MTGQHINGDGKFRVFAASLATETNTFSPIFTGLSDFYDAFYAPPGKHPSTPTLCSAPLIACREHAARGDWTLIEGTSTWAEPGGIVSRTAYETLRDEILQQLQNALPLDAVVFGLHGAMVAQDYPDCEGDLLERARHITGNKTIIAASFDPHSHLSQRRLKMADIVTAFKEFPHTDFMDCARVLASLTRRNLCGEIRPAVSVFDCRMIDVMPTSAEPMRSFVDRLTTLEKNGDALSISVIHGFLAGDVPDLGAKIIVVTDNERARGDALAQQLGMELYALRGQTRMNLLTPDDALSAAANGTANGAPVVIADVWDNPGGGVAGDSTVLLKEILQRGMRNAAIATIWDPLAVRHCFAAGEGACIPLRFGAKSGPGTGEPADEMVRILRLHPDMTQRFGESIVRMGGCASVRILRNGENAGVDVILNSVRAQTFSPSLFSEMGVAPSEKTVLVVKSTNHFYDAFSSLAGKILYADSGTPYPSDPRQANYKNLTRAIWPIVENPHD